MPTKTPMEPMESDVVMTAPEPAAEAPKKGKLTLILVVLIVAVVGVLGFLGFEYMKLKQDPNAVNQKKIEVVVVKVEKLIDLPQGEIPTLATVSDTTNLAGQPFFANAEVGDQVLLYTNARKAYLYSPSKNLIVEVASLNIGE
jgi:hypothetical protein